MLKVSLNPTWPPLFPPLYITACHNHSSQVTPARATIFLLIYYLTQVISPRIVILKVTLQLRVEHSFQLRYTGGGHNHSCRFKPAGYPNRYSYSKAAWAAIFSVTSRRRLSQSF